MTDQAPEIISTESPFARDVFTKRHPALIERVSGAWPFGPEQVQALSALAEENVSGGISRLPHSAADGKQWADWGSEFYGRPWAEVPFLWAESFFYRRLLEVTGFFGTGLWRGVDPFAPFKQAELAGEVVAAEVRALDQLSDMSEQDQRSAVLLGSLWGNQADLGFQITGGKDSAVSGLVADESQRLWEVLDEGKRGGTVAMVADNAGSELVADLVLTDYLLTRGVADEVVLHVKPAPYYVSDATIMDVADCLRRLLQSTGQARTIGERLHKAAAAGRLRVRAHAFFCAPFDYTRMPDDLVEQFAAATVTVLKGDLNYRRLVGDRWWEPTVPFDEVTAYFPGRVAALRTLKSDVVVGLDASAVVESDAAEPGWRTSGSHALIQVRS